MLIKWIVKLFEEVIIRNKINMFHIITKSMNSPDVKQYAPRNPIEKALQFIFQ